jgi:hypothetical protein
VVLRALERFRVPAFLPVLFLRTAMERAFPILARFYASSRNASGSTTGSTSSGIDLR